MHKYAKRITKNMNQKELYEAGIQEKPKGYEIVSLTKFKCSSKCFLHMLL